MAKTGWFKESSRHSLAAKGIRTGSRKAISSKLTSFTLKGNSGKLLPYLAAYRGSKPTTDELQEYFNIENVPPDFAMSLSKGSPEFDLDSQQNDSPTMGDMIKIAKEHNGTLEGYVIPTESGRNDARVSFDGFTLAGKTRDMIALREELSPDEFQMVGSKYRFWWD